jgi:hypothetical protein
MGLNGRPPQALMLALRDAFSVGCFLETGTHRGATAAWAAQHFRQVVTIEASEELHSEAVTSHGHLGNVRFVHGDTRDVLPGEVDKIDGPAIVWLDSHWSGGETYGEGDECPVLFEIETLRTSRHEHYLFIDDARCFIAPPPRPHDMDQWPTLTELTDALTRGERPLEVLVLDDAFVAVPRGAKELVRRHAQDMTTQAWDLLRAPPAAERDLHARARRFVARLRRAGLHWPYAAAP